jgi:hypothetical protein
MSKTVEISREYQLPPIVIAAGGTASTVLNITRFAFGSIQLPDAITGALKWQVSLDEVNWTDDEAITFVANKALKIPDNVWNFPAARILSDGAEAAERTFRTFSKG